MFTRLCADSSAQRTKRPTSTSFFVRRCFRGFRKQRRCPNKLEQYRMTWLQRPNTHRTKKCSGRALIRIYDKFETKPPFGTSYFPRFSLGSQVVTVKLHLTLTWAVFYANRKHTFLTQPICQSFWKVRCRCRDRNSTTPVYSAHLATVLQQM